MKPSYLRFMEKESFSAIPRCVAATGVAEAGYVIQIREITRSSIQARATWYLPTYLSTYSTRAREAIVTEYKSRVYLLLYDPRAPIADKTRQYGDQGDGLSWGRAGGGRTCVGVHACSRQSTDEVDTERDKTARARAREQVRHFISRVQGIPVIILSISRHKEPRESLLSLRRRWRKKEVRKWRT